MSIAATSSEVPRQGASLAVEGLRRLYGSVKAVDDVSLAIEPGEFLSMVGPSGSGKTTLLMMIAGFEEPTAGRIAVDGRDITREPPNRRNMGMVFQKYALFPHMTVAQNIAFPLRMRAVSRSERDARIHRALDMVQLAGYGDRRPAQLSGGQQQRVALARAIVFGPPVVLMDEPLGALDRKLRQHMQLELKDLQSRLGVTVVYVTHDQEEALTMSDRVAILKDGQLRQVGNPREVYDRPADAFVGDFFGEMNLLRGTFEKSEGTTCRVRIAEHILEAQRMSPGAALGTAATIGVRPEHVTVITDDDAQVDRTLPGHLVRLVFSGPIVMALVALTNGATVKASLPLHSSAVGLAPGTAVSVRFTPSHTMAFAPEASHGQRT